MIDPLSMIDPTQTNRSLASQLAVTSIRKTYMQIQIQTQAKMSVTATTKSRVIFYYDVVCPFAYMTSTLVEDLAKRAGATVHWSPVLLGKSYHVPTLGNCIYQLAIL